MSNPNSCPVCASSHLDCLLLENLPVSAHPFCPQPSSSPLITQATLYKCNDCSHMFLDVKPVTYYKRVIRSVSISAEMSLFRDVQFNQLRSKFFPSDKTDYRVLEIGAGNGQYSSILSRVFGHCYATEPSQRDQLITSSEHITYLDTHPDEPDFSSAISQEAPYDIVCCFSYLEHLPFPQRTLCQLNHVLADGGVALFEVPNSTYIQKNSLLNEIIPDHLHYFTANSFISAITNAGFEISSFDSVWHNYILSATVQKVKKNRLNSMMTEYEQLTSTINAFLESLTPSSTLVIWGAGHQSLFTITSTNLRERVSFIVDSSPTKQGTYLPESNIPIYAPSRLDDISVDVLIVICAGYNSEVLANLQSFQSLRSAKLFSLTDNRLLEH